MKNIYHQIANAKNQKLLAILLDPDKLRLDDLVPLMQKINSSPASHILVGGSSFEGHHLDEMLQTIKKETQLPILLFPGNPAQISPEADAILFLSLLSGRNPDFLIEHHVNAVPLLKKTNLEVIPTAYLLLESGHETAVQRVTKTQPLPLHNANYILQTAQAGEYLGHQLIYLEAGSGAANAIPTAIIELVSQNTSIPVIVGGGIRSKEAIDSAFAAGANMVVIGTAFENDSNFFT